MNVMQFALILLFMAVSGSNAYAAEVSCKTAECHSRVGGTKNFHLPVKEEDCVACHKQTNPAHPLKGRKSFVLTSEGAALCYQCHDKFNKKKVGHPPVREGECTYCHNPHGGVERYLLGVGSDQSNLCYGCHEPAPFQRKYRHGPVAVGQCTKCHDPHESNAKALLGGAVVWETCLKCHVDVIQSLKESVFIHTPVKNGPCTACHSPHSSDYVLLLKKGIPAICLDCHKKMVKQLKAKTVHKPLLQEGGCSTCHSTHFAKAGKLLSGDDKTICLACHGTDKLGNPPLRNIKAEIEGKKYLHGPIKKNGCKDCHDPHGNDNYRLLKGNYPADLYVPYKDGAYSACLNCHDKNLLRFAETTIYTKFRNGNRNLHFVHVANTRKGRSCRMCHQPHASNGVKLIDKEVQKFGEWQIPVNFNITPTGGSCAPGCHQAFEYDREKAVVFSK